MMKFLLKRNKEFIFTHSCWMSTQVCIYLCPVLVIIDSMFQSSLYYPPSFYSFCHLLQMLLKPLLMFIILMTVQIVSYRYVKFPFLALTWCRRHSIIMSHYCFHCFLIFGYDEIPWWCTLCPLHQVRAVFCRLTIWYMSILCLHYVGIHKLKASLPPRDPKSIRAQPYDPIPPVAEQISLKWWLLCFDEFQVTLLIL